MSSNENFPTTQNEQLAFIESVLFVSREPVKADTLIHFLQLKNIKDLETLFETMEEKLNQSDRGIMLKRTGGGYELTTKPTLHNWLKEYFTIKAQSRLTIPSLETLAIISYRQPVTIAEISDMRGVNSTGPVKNLLQKKLIKITGRKAVPGRPALYSTTKEFLIYFGLNNLKELPSLEELTEMFEEKEQPSLFG